MEAAISAKLEALKEVDEEPGKRYKLMSIKGRNLKDAINSKELLEKHEAFTGGKVLTRFPPEPNGYLHIGHARAMRFSFDSAREYGGHCYLRFDDTNPAAEEQEYIDNIIENVNFLGYSPWKITYSSDYFQEIYDSAIFLIKKGSAYVDESSSDEMSRQKEKKEDSPYRNRSVEENLELFEAMTQNKLKAVLRMKIDMKSENPNLRDPAIYRVINSPHPHTGDKWKVYPLYDFTHGTCDSIENITHSLCTLEFEVRRDLYYRILAELDIYRPFVYEYSRLNVTRTVLSKRKIKTLVDEKYVNGWDDPRLYTINGLRRRGYSADAINNFIDSCGIARRGNENFISYKKLEHALKTDLDKKSKRLMSVVRPLEVLINNLPEGSEKLIELPFFPKDTSRGNRTIRLTNKIYIDRNDFKEEADDDFNGLTLKQEVGLKSCGVIRVVEVIKENGEVSKLVCSYEEVEKKTKGRIHWLSVEEAVGAEFRLYSHLFKVDFPGEKGDYLQDLNENSLIIELNSLVHRDIYDLLQTDLHFQFERLGYFVLDKDSNLEEKKLVFNRTIEI